MPTVALATSAALPGLAPDDRLLLEALRAAGLTAEPVVWDDPLAEWTDLTVIRSCWDYSYRREAFEAWIRRVPRLLNPPSVVLPNLHKSYLVDLAAAGVPAVPTQVIQRGVSFDLDAAMAEAGWPHAVIKAAVGQAGRYARTVRQRDTAAAARFAARVLEREDLLLQPFVSSIAVTGELSIVWLDGEFTHAVRKRGPAGEFRVHDDYGGTVEREDPSPAALAVAQQALDAVDGVPLYARVDLADGPDGPLVMELELIDPELFFRHASGSAERIAAGIERYLSD